MNAPVIVNHDDADLPFGGDWNTTAPRSAPNTP